MQAICADAAGRQLFMFRPRRHGVGRYGGEIELYIGAGVSRGGPDRKTERNERQNNIRRYTCKLYLTVVVTLITKQGYCGLPFVRPPNGYRLMIQFGRTQWLVF